MKSTEELVAELLAREAIRDLPVRYCDCVWRNDMKRLVNLFASDASFTVTGRKRNITTSGRPALLKMYKGAIGAASPRPYIHNHVVTLSSKDKGIGRCYVELRGAKRNFEWIGTGFYEDEYVRTTAGWKFASRKFTRAYTTPAAAQS